VNLPDRDQHSCGDDPESAGLGAGFSRASCPDDEKFEPEPDFQHPALLQRCAGRPGQVIVVTTGIREAEGSILWTRFGQTHDEHVIKQ